VIFFSNENYGEDRSKIADTKLSTGQRQCVE